MQRITFMIPAETALTALPATAAALWIADAFKPDVRDFILSKLAGPRAILRNISANEFPSLFALRAAIAAGTVKEGDWIRVKCKVSPFGHAARGYLLPSSSGNRSGMRKGPQLPMSLDSFPGVVAPILNPRWTPKSGHQWTPENRPPQAS